ncbi:hypothetical protein H2200_004955 [Cladophialophora chaetospira]|uniref:BTB domain-containing protein n=1 Tax=Cladophialophora chaetospira TaxID=386627 RepID=A0AA38XE28_9EURO|nr:hypothetical protein H2200_004955 [Cladophialophora chaetospira]
MDSPRFPEPLQVATATSARHKDPPSRDDKAIREAGDTIGLQILTSPVVTLRVGPNNVTLTAHKAVLTTTAHFAKCLEEGRFEEGDNKIITLPEDDPAYMAAVIRFLYCGYIFVPKSRASETYLTYLIKLYAIADKYCIEKMCEYAVTLVEGKHQPLLIWDHVEQLKSMGLRGSSLWKSFTIRIQHRLRGGADVGIDLEKLWRDGLRADDETSIELVGRLIGRVTSEEKEASEKQRQESTMYGLFDFGSDTTA